MEEKIANGQSKKLLRRFKDQNLSTEIQTLNYLLTQVPEACRKRLMVFYKMKPLEEEEDELIMNIKKKEIPQVE